MSTICETLPESFQNLSPFKQSNETKKQTNRVPHCEIHEQLYRGCIDCLRARDKYIYDTQRSVRIYCNVCKIWIVKHIKNRHLLTGKHQILSKIV